MHVFLRIFEVSVQYVKNDVLTPIANISPKDLQSLCLHVGKINFGIKFFTSLNANSPKLQRLAFAEIRFCATCKTQRI